MTFPTAPGAPTELLATYISVVPSLAGSQGLLRDQLREMAREGSQVWGAEFERSAGAAIRPAMARLSATMAEGLTAGLGSSVGQAVLSKLLPNAGEVSRHFGNLGAQAKKSYVEEFERNFSGRGMVPVIEDMSAKAVAANKALVESTRQMGGTMSQFWYKSSAEATRAGDEMMADWATKMKVGGALAAAAVVVEFAAAARKEAKEFAAVGEEAAGTVMGAFQAVMQGKMPDLIAPFNTLEHAAKAALTAPLEFAQILVPPLHLVKSAVEDLFPPFDALKNTVTPLMSTMLDVGNEYLQLQRTLAGATIDPEKVGGLSAAVREIMASGAVVHFEDVAESIGRLSQNIKGLSTEQLKELTTTFAEAEELVGHIDETKFAGIINAWKIPAAEANSTLTMLTNTSRATGVGINELTSEMIRSGPAFRDFGYSAQQSAAFFGEMTAQGEQGQRLVLAMMEVDKKLNDEVEKGQFPNAKAAWQSLLESVQAYEKAGQDAAAKDLLEQHGVSERVAPMFLEMLKNGKISADQLGDAIEGVNTDIGESVEKSKDLGQTFEVIKQQISAALSPVGTVLAAGLRDGGNHVTEWLKDNQVKVAQWAADIAKGFMDVGTFATVWFANIMNAMAPLLEMAKDAVLAVTLPLSPLAHGMAAVFGGGWDTLAGAIDKANGSMMNFDFGKVLGEFDARANLFMQDTLPKIDAQIQSPVDNLKLEETMKQKGFKFWFEDGDPAKVKVKGQTPDGKPIDTAADVVPPGETSVTFTPDPAWQSGRYFTPPQVPKFAFGGPTVPAVNGLPTSGDHIPAYLEVGEYVVNRAAAQRHRRELDAINYGHVGYDTGGQVGLEVLYGFLRGVAGGIGLDLPKDKSGDGGSGSSFPMPRVSTPYSASADASTAGGVPLVQNPDGTWTSPNPAWAHLIQRESSGRANIVQQITDVNSGGNEAQGLFQITPATWREHGGTEFAPTPNQATAQQQAVVAARIIKANPSGSDWGAGLSGRENAAALLAGLQGARGYKTGGQVGDRGSWFGSTVHEHPGPDTASIAKHFAHFHDGGCAECGGAHPTGFCGGGIAKFAGGGSVDQFGVDTTGAQIDTIQIADALAQMYPGHTQYLYRSPDGFNEHSSGEATDFMVGNDTALGYAVKDWALQQPGVKYALWQQKEWDKGGTVTPMENRGSPTQNHMDHVHIRTEGGGFPQGRGPGPQGIGSMPAGTSNTPSAPPTANGVQLTSSTSPFSSVPVSGDGSNAFNGGSFPPGSPIGPQGLIGPGYNPWTNPPPGLRGQKLEDFTNRYERWQLDEARRHRANDKAQADLAQATQEQTDAQTTYNKALADANTKKAALQKQITDYIAAHPGTSESAAFEVLDPQTAKTLKDAYDKLNQANDKLANARDTAANDQMEQQVGHPPPKPEGGREGGPFESMSEQLGGGLVKGIAQELGFPDVFGKPIWQWGISKLLMGGLGFGLNVANQRGLFGDAFGAPGNAFPGSLPDQFGGPHGTPPGPPAGSPDAPAPQPPSAPGPGGGTPGFPTPPQTPAPPAAPSKPQLHWDAGKGQWFDNSGNLIQPWRFQAPTSAGGLGGNFEIGKPVPPPPPPAPKAPLQPPLGPAPHGADHWDPNKGWVDAQGNPVGTPGGGQSAPFGIPGMGAQLFGVGNDNGSAYEAAANVPAPFNFSGSGPAVGGLGQGFDQFINALPNRLVKMQDDRALRDRFNPNSSANLTAQMVPAKPDDNRRYQTGPTTIMNVNQNGIMSPGESAEKIRQVAVRDSAWKGPNSMFAMGLQLS